MCTVAKWYFWFSNLLIQGLLCSSTYNFGRMLLRVGWTYFEPSLQMMNQRKLLMMEVNSSYTHWCVAASCDVFSQIVHLAMDYHSGLVNISKFWVCAYINRSINGAHKVLIIPKWKNIYLVVAWIHLRSFGCDSLYYKWNKIQTSYTVYMESIF